MLLIALLAGLMILVLTSIIIELIMGQSPSRSRLKRHVLTFNGITLQKKRSSLSLNFIKSYSKIYKVFVLPFLIIFALIFGIFIIKNIYIFIFTLFIVIMIGIDMQRSIRKKWKDKVSRNMRDFLISVMNSLKTGTSIHNAISNSISDLKRLPGGNSENPLIAEVEKIVKDIHMGRNLDEALIAFRNRVNMEDVDIFVNITLKLNEKGGDITEILSMVADMIGEKVIFKRDIMTLTAGKRYEAGILTVVPIILLIVLTLSSPSYMEPMFNTALGQLMTFIGFIMLAANYFIGKRIVNIEV